MGRRHLARTHRRKKKKKRNSGERESAHRRTLLCAKRAFFHDRTARHETNAQNTTHTRNRGQAKGGREGRGEKGATLGMSLAPLCSSSSSSSSSSCSSSSSLSLQIVLRLVLLAPADLGPQPFVQEKQRLFGDSHQTQRDRIANHRRDESTLRGRARGGGVVKTGNCGRSRFKGIKRQARTLQLLGKRAHDAAICLRKEAALIYRIKTQSIQANPIRRSEVAESSPTTTSRQWWRRWAAAAAAHAW